MTKKRKVRYPVPKTATRRAPAPGSDQSIERPNLATINMSAGAGRAGFSVGDKVRIEGSGLFAGETVTIEKLSGGVIPSALVRTASGSSRQVRTIDLVPAEPRGSEASGSAESSRPADSSSQPNGRQPGDR